MLEKFQKEEGKSFKQMVNEILRLGIVEKNSAGKKDQTYYTLELTRGPCKYPNLDNIGEIIAVAEREDYS